MHTHNNYRHQVPATTLTCMDQVAFLSLRDQKVYTVVIERKEKEKQESKAAPAVSGLLVCVAFPSCFVGGVR